VPFLLDVEVGSLLPNVEIVERWREPDVVAEATERMRSFLQAHTPVLVR